MKIFYTVLYNNEKYHEHTFNIHICHLNNKKKLLTKDVILLIWSLAFDNDMPDLSQTLSRPCCNVLSWMFRLCTKNILNSVSQRWWPATTRWFQARWLLCCVCYSSYCSPSRTIPSFLDSFHTDYSWKISTSNIDKRQYSFPTHLPAPSRSVYFGIVQWCALSQISSNVMAALLQLLS